MSLFSLCAKAERKKYFNNRRKIVALLRILVYNRAHVTKISPFFCPGGLRSKDGICYLADRNTKIFGGKINGEFKK